jgi:hypothetical protein
VRRRFRFVSPPANSTSGVFIRNNSTLQGIALSNNQILWRFAGNGALVARSRRLTDRAVNDLLHLKRI